jgi:hypothetical protein
VSDDAYGGNDPTVPHFHATRSGGGFGAVEHGPHRGLPNRRHVHQDMAGLLPSTPEAPIPPGLAGRPTKPSERVLRRRNRRLFMP